MAKRKLSMTPANIKRRKHNNVEYRKYQASAKRRKYRSTLNKTARKMGVYGKRDAMGKDLGHHGGKITGLESRHTNRAAGARYGTKVRTAKSHHRVRRTKRAH